MSSFQRPRTWDRLRASLAVLAVVAVAVFASWPPAAALACEGLALDDGCLFTITGGDTDDPNDGFAVTNADGVPLWDFVRERDLQAIGYPISQRWRDGPFTLQAFQKVILQWDPGQQRMNYYNTLDVLANRYSEVELPNVPPHQVLEADRGADFATITRNHLALLDQNDAIKQRFLSEPDWLNLYGLPIRYEEREVDGNPQGLQMLRAQRTVFVIWNVPAPGTTVGRVNLQNVPDKVKRLSNVIIPDAAKAPVLRAAVSSLPAFTLPTPTPDPTPTPAQAPTAVPTPPPASAPTSDREVLVSIFHETGGPSWVNNSNWLSDAPLDTWHGVTADGHGQVLELRLVRNDLRGSVPIALAYLGKLRFLDLWGNELRGAIPPELGNLSELTGLRLGANELTGTIPPQLSHLGKLRSLWLADNELTGTIPPELGRLANLYALTLGGNQLQGEIPASLGNLSMLGSLGLGYNELSGEIPAALSRLTNLRDLSLHGNRLRGTIPPWLPQLSHLRELGLSENLLQGAIPPWLGQLVELEWLGLSANQFQGPIPPELGNLRKLRSLGLDGNRLTGAIPPELGSLTSLKDLYLYDNQLSGAIPPELGSLASLVHLYLGGNRLVGAIPPELSNLVNLELLSLYGNQLSGAIPPELGRLANLLTLSLGGSNRFTGCIPSGLRDVETNDLGTLGLPFC